MASDSEIPMPDSVATFPFKPASTSGINLWRLSTRRRSPTPAANSSGSTRRCARSMNRSCASPSSRANITGTSTTRMTSSLRGRGPALYDLDDRIIKLSPRQGFVIKGCPPPLRAPQRTVILVVENTGVVPTGDWATPHRALMVGVSFAFRRSSARLCSPSAWIFLIDRGRSQATGHRPRCWSTSTIALP